MNRMLLYYIMKIVVRENGEVHEIEARDINSVSYSDGFVIIEMSDATIHNVEVADSNEYYLLINKIREANNG